LEAAGSRRYPLAVHVRNVVSICRVIALWRMLRHLVGRALLDDLALVQM